MINDIAVIIRSSGERTEELCRYEIEQQVNPDNVVVIHEKPFSKALYRGFEIGIDYGLPWSLYVDADLLVQAGAIRTLSDRLEEYPADILGGHGCILDKMYGKVKNAGPHLYRTSLLKETIKYVLDANTSLRPETYAKDGMAYHGHNWIQLPDMIAIHDYEQFYGDIYRTMIVRAHKSQDTVKHLLNRADKLSKKDKDFLICAMALRIAMSREDNIQLHSEQWREESDFLLTALGETEKAELKVPEHAQLADRVIRAYLQQKKLRKLVEKPVRLLRRYKR